MPRNGLGIYLSGPFCWKQVSAALERLRFQNFGFGGFSQHNSAFPALERQQIGSAGLGTDRANRMGLPQLGHSAG
jgi:hypothetical protein